MRWILEIKTKNRLQIARGPHLRSILKFLAQKIMQGAWGGSAGSVERRKVPFKSSYPHQTKQIRTISGADFFCLVFFTFNSSFFTFHNFGFVLKRKTKSEKLKVVLTQDITQNKFAIACFRMAVLVRGF